jgi:hypothetical protein
VQSHARLSDVLAAGEILQGRFEIFTLAAGQKSEPAEVDAENRDVLSVEKARASQQRSVAAKREQRIESRRVFETRTSSRYFVDSLLEQRDNVQSRGNPEQCAQNPGELFVTLMSNDTEAH